MRPVFAALLVFFLLSSAAPVLADSVTHSVQPGDSLSTIAERYGVSVSALEARNHLRDSSILQIGQEIVVPVHVRHTVSTAPVASASAHPGAPSLLVAAALHGARAGSITPARLLAAKALWVAMHAGSAPPSIPGMAPFEVAQHLLAIDAGVTRTAMRYLGVPYSWGGTSYSGVDCSGFVWAVFAKNGIDLPRMADGQFAMGRRIAIPLLMPGDLVFFETYTSGASHVGIYLGDGRFIHASTRGVVIDALSMSYYATRYIGARRLIQ